MNDVLSVSLSLEVSFTWLCKGYGGSRAMGVITALGIIQLNAPSIPRWRSSSSAFYLCAPYRRLKGQEGQRAVWGGRSMSRSSGWTSCRLAFPTTGWILFTGNYLLTHSGRAVQTARDRLLKRSPSAKKQTAVTTPALKNHTITFTQDNLFLDANRKGGVAKGR